jgi:hypothetical protein
LADHKKIFEIISFMDGHYAIDNFRTFKKRQEVRDMLQMKVISQITMRRLLNYQRVVENEARAAARLQWKKMTLDSMRRAEAASQKSVHIRAIVAYAASLFRIQNNMPSYRPFHEDYLLHNGLVELMNELRIPIKSISIDIPHDGIAYKVT